MDGCWEPWLIGCVIDWNAWAAIGTFVATGAALLLAGRDRRERFHQERQQALLIVRVCNVELDRIGLTSAALIGNKEFDAQVALLATSKGLQDLFEERLTRLQAPEMRALLDRMHLLPPSLAEDLARTMTACDALRDGAKVILRVMRADADNVDENVERAGTLIRMAGEVFEAATKAEEHCIAFLHAPPRAGRTQSWVARIVPRSDLRTLLDERPQS